MANLSLGETQFASYGNKISHFVRETDLRGKVLFFRYLIKSFVIHRARDSAKLAAVIKVTESSAANKINH